MSDDDWGDLDQVEKKKRSPALMFCGVGCVAMLVLVLAGGFWMYRAFERSLDPEVQWEELNELIAYDRRPTGWQMRAGFQLGMADFEIYVLTSTEILLVEDEPAMVDGELPEGAIGIGGGEEVTRAVTILQIPDSVDAMFDPTSDSVDIWTPDGQVEPLTHIVVQGRTLRLALVDSEGRTEVNFWSGDGEGEGSDVDVQADQPAVVVDLTPEGAEFPIVLYWAQEDLQALSPDQIRAFLAPFHIGPER